MLNWRGRILSAVQQKPTNFSIDFGISQQGGQIYLLNWIIEQAKICEYGEKKSQKLKQACLFIRDFRID